MRSGLIVVGCLLMVGSFADPTPAEAQPRSAAALIIKDAAFTDEDRTPPVSRVEVFGPIGDTLWFWFELSCSLPCESELALNGELVLEILWLFDPGSGPGIDHGDRVKLPGASGHLVVSKAASSLRPGRWAAAVAFGTDLVCLADQRTCNFPVRVTR